MTKDIEKTTEEGIGNLVGSKKNSRKIYLILKYSLILLIVLYFVLLMFKFLF